MVGEEPHINFADATGVLEAGSLFWLDLRWPATAGVPLNIFNVKSLPNTVFKEPTPYPVDALRVAVTPGYNPHHRRGEWRGLCPEELTHGMICAVADAVRSEAGNTDLLNAWKRCLLSTTLAFQVPVSYTHLTLPTKRIV